MSTLTLAPLAFGSVPQSERHEPAGKPARRGTLDTSSKVDRRPVRPVPQAGVQARQDATQWQSTEAALLKLHDVLFACCADFPSDEELDLRIRTQCSRIEATLRPADVRPWRCGRDCLLARLGFRPLLG